MLVKVYLGIVVVRWLWSFLPGLLVGLLFGLYYQFKGTIDPYLKPIINRIGVWRVRAVNWMLLRMPRHEGIKSEPPQLEEYVAETEDTHDKK